MQINCFLLEDEMKAELLECSLTWKNTDSESQWNPMATFRSTLVSTSTDGHMVTERVFNAKGHLEGSASHN